MNLRIFVQTLFLCGVFSTYSARAAESAKSGPLNDQGGQKVFAKVFPLVFKVKTSPSAESPQASYGTGFVVDRGGLLITNYHVVSESITEPKKNKIFVVLDEKPIPAKVLAVDVVRDLALIRVDKAFSQAISFASSKPAQGAPIYSIGQPEDLNMAIVGGTYNDELTYGEYNIIHLSAPINAGMSGGPTVDQNGELIGVNVSKLVASSNLSFSVPKRFAEELYQKNKNLQDSPKTFWAEMESQLSVLQDSLTQEILKKAEQEKEIHQWQVPEAPKTLKCWSVNDRNKEEEKEKYDDFEELCRLEHSAFINSEISSGTYEIGFKVLENKKLNTWQFYQLISSVLDRKSFAGLRSRETEDKPKLRTKGECFSSVVVNKASQTFKLGYCARTYTHFPHLQDAHIVLSTLGSSSSNLSGDLLLEGFSEENIKKILAKYIESIGRGKP